MPLCGPGALPCTRNPSAYGAREWLASGDAGQLDGAGELTIFGRTGDAGRLENGTAFYPGRIEVRLKAIPEIAQALVLWRGRDYCSAILSLEPSAERALAEAGGPAGEEGDGFAWFAKAYELLHPRIEGYNKSLNGDNTLAALQIRRFLILPRDFSVEAGEVTRNRELHRRASRRAWPRRLHQADQAELFRS